MGKRAASRTAHSEAKHARKAEDAGEDAHLAPVLELLAQADNLSETCRDMLAAMMPFCLNAPKDSRHPYQSKMVDVLDTVVSGIEANHVASVAAAEGSVQEAGIITESASKDVATATEAKDAAETERSLKEEALKDASQATADAEEALAASKASVENLEGERAQQIEEKAEYERALEETWTPLREATVPGQKWRERAKMITAIIDMMGKVGIVPSLAGGLPLALKMKTADRGPFANKCVQVGEDLLKGHVASLGERLGNMDAEAEARAKAVVDAESALKDAQALKESCQVELTNSESTLSEKVAGLKVAAKTLKDSEKKLKQLEAALEQVRESQAGAKALTCSFEAVRDGAPAEPAVEAPAEEPAEAPAEAPEVEMQSVEAAA